MPGEDEDVPVITVVDGQCTVCRKRAFVVKDMSVCLNCIAKAIRRKR